MERKWSFWNMDDTDNTDLSNTDPSQAWRINGIYSVSPNLRGISGTPGGFFLVNQLNQCQYVASDPHVRDQCSMSLYLSRARGIRAQLYFLCLSVTSVSSVFPCFIRVHPYHPPRVGAGYVISIPIVYSCFNFFLSLVKIFLLNSGFFPKLSSNPTSIVVAFK